MVLAQAQWFITTLTGDVNTKCIFQLIDNNEKRAARNQTNPAYVKAHTLFGTFDELKYELSVRNRDGYGVYVTVNEAKADRRRKEDMVRIRAVFHEDDDGYKHEFPLPPTLTIESSIGKFHRYWLPYEHWTPDEEYDDIQRCLVKNYGGDKNARDVARVLRVPGFYNHKYAEPFMVRVATAPLGPLYSRAQLIEAFPAPAIPGERAADAAPRAALRPEQRPRYEAIAAGTLRGAAADLAATPRGKREATLFAKACKMGAWVREGLIDRAEVEAALTEASRANGFLASDGAAATARQIARGLTQGAENDELPDLDAPALAALGAPLAGRESAPTVDVGELESLTDLDTLLGRLAAMADTMWLPLVNRLRANHGNMSYADFKAKVYKTKAKLEKGKEDATVANMNERFAFLSQDVAIYRHEFGDVITRKDFGTLLENERIYFPETDKWRPAADVWAQSKERRTYRTVTLAPDQGPVTAAGDINLWRGWACAPVQGSIAPFLQLLEHVVPDPVERQHVLQWLGGPIRFPGLKMNYALLLWSLTHGVGKSLILNFVRKLYGKHGRMVDNEEYTSDFTDWMNAVLFVEGDEISLGFKHMPKTKSLISGSTITINPKYGKKLVLDNRLNIAFSSNEPDAIKLNYSDRRFLIIHAAETVLSPEVYAAIVAWFENGGMAHLLYFFMYELDYTGFAPLGRAPATAAKTAMIEESMSDLEVFVKERTEEKKLFTASFLRAQFKDAYGKEVSNRALGAVVRKAGYIVRPLWIGPVKERVYAPADWEQATDLAWIETFKKKA